MDKTVLQALWQRITATFASKAQLEAMGDQKQDRLTAGEGISISGGVISSGSSVEEVVHVTVTTNVSGVSVEGLQILVYYNSAAQPSATITTDANGMAALRVPTGYRYRLVFPSVEGCVDIGSIEHVATMAERSIEVELVEPASVGETVQVTVLEKNGNSYVAVEGVAVVVAYGGNTEQYPTDTDGKATFLVPSGETYTLTLPDRDGYYMMPTVKSQSYYANRTIRYITARYQDPQSGIFIVASDGTEYSPDEWGAAVEGGLRQNEDAKVIKVATAALVAAGGVFGIDIDMVRDRTYKQSLAWCTQNVKFNSIPENGNSSSALYYYDGLSASKLIQAEGDDRSLDTPAVDDCLGRSITLGDVTHEGFLGSIGQWAQLWGNVTAIDEILLSVRPNGTSLLGQVVALKWSSTQVGAIHAWSWGSSASNNGKNAGYAVVPFFAY